MPIPAKQEIPLIRQGLDSAELTPDGGEILVGGFAGVYTLDVASGKVARRYRDYEGNVVWSARMTRDGKRVVATGGGAPMVWDAKTGAVIGSLAGEKLGDERVRIHETP